MTITTARDAEAAAAFWRRRVQGLEQTLPAVLGKGDPVDLDQHLSDLRAARIAQRRALSESRAVRHEKPLRGPVYLNTPAKADQRVPILSTAEVRRYLHAHQLSGKHAGPRKFAWRPRDEREATQLMQTFGISTTKSGSRRRGFAVERLI